MCVSVWLTACLKHWVCVCMPLEECFCNISYFACNIIVFVSGGVSGVTVISEVAGVRNAGCVCVSIIAVYPGALKQPIFVCLILGVMATIACVRMGLQQGHSPMSVGLAWLEGGGWRGLYVFNKLCLPIAPVQTHVNPLDSFLGLLVRICDVELRFTLHQG